jgi:copper chaperone
METLELKVTGMSCGGCENTVRRAVSSVAGVASVTASHKENRVTVDYDATKADRGAIAEAIRRAGYTVAA